MSSGRWKSNATPLAALLAITLAGCATRDEPKPLPAPPQVVETPRPRLAPAPAWILEAPDPKRREPNFRRKLESFFAPRPTAPTR